LFTQPNCPRCPGVKKIVEELRTMNGFNLREVNAMTDDGMLEAISHNLMTTPAIVINNDAEEVKLVGNIAKEDVIATIKRLGG
jgi:glutaredoxin